jgi:hypothetical protein
MDSRIISRRLRKKILRLKTNPKPLFDLRNKLEVFAVKTGLKPSCVGTLDLMNSGSKFDDNISSLKQIAKMVGLKHKVTTTPPLYFSRPPNVPESFLDAYYDRDNFEMLWIYDNPEVESSIDKCLSGKLNEGHVLGYPKCCIDWHEEKRVLEVESRLSREDAEFQLMLEEHVLGTWKKYSFVSHWACSSCLSEESRETKKLNQKYRELAIRIGEDFRKKLVLCINLELEKFKRG